MIISETIILWEFYISLHRNTDVAILPSPCRGQIVIGERPYFVGVLSVYSKI